jgi:hypothetical protein
MEIYKKRKILYLKKKRSWEELQAILIIIKD